MTVTSLNFDYFFLSFDYIVASNEFNVNSHYRPP